MRKERKGDFLWEMLFYGVLLLFVLLIFSFRTTGKKIPRFLGGYSCLLVLTESMGEVIPKDSFVLTKEIEPKQLFVGDDITFLANETTVVTHRIVEKKETPNGLVFRTKGITNKEIDSQPVSMENIVGKVVFHNLFLGKFMIFLYRWGVPILLFASVAAVICFILRRQNKG